ncbi:magnesium transporter MgtE N-terminal domain-containing protein [Arthrobacter cryoconiti]|uniref:Magnesium transporter MgtE N-terminal domain-containing protein n=1 Tax=Arthrobacter cryoconiti TaxID=748907 RepID=A0ABV8R3Z1_9MICC|nr:CBS domain-containing protein [Arthrobacter cryoconiti]MCC9069406.1 CBS domain-containing protein [Arthrobacter cryoconiti]
MNTPPLKLSALLKNAVIDAKGLQIGTLADLIVCLNPDHAPQLSGLVLRIGSGTVYAPISIVLSMTSERITLASARLDLRPFERRDGEVLLRADVLGHRMIDIGHAALVRAYDVQLEHNAQGWTATGVDTHKARRLNFNRDHETHPVRRWEDFEPLIGHTDSLASRAGGTGLDRLKAPQFADLIEEATTDEQNELLNHVHGNPELEADVFEELDDDSQSEILAARTNRETAAILGRMRPDDAADALMDLPQDRRTDVLGLLPQPQRARVTKLLGFHDATAGGLMGLDFIQFPPDTTIALALTALSRSTTSQPEALNVLFSIDTGGRLVGSLGLVQALQLPQDTLLLHACDPDPVFATPGDDVVDVTNRMADFNLLLLPVLDPEGRILGVVTVDDALEAAIPQDWRRREAQPHPSTPTNHH